MQLGITFTTPSSNYKVFNIMIGLMLTLFHSISGIIHLHAMV